MTSTFSAAFQTAAMPAYGSTTGPICEIITLPTQMVPRVKYLSVGFFAPSPIAAETITIGIGKPATSGTAKRSYSFITENLGSTVPNFLTVADDWNVLPTVPANFFRRITFGAPITSISTNWYDFYFPRGLAISAGSSLAVWGISLPAVITTQSLILFDISIKAEM